jgi:hypothetical protein
MMHVKEDIDGLKTYLGGAGFILWGVSDVLISIYEETPVDWNIAIGKLIAGWTIIGGRSALEKLR